MKFAFTHARLIWNAHDHVADFRFDPVREGRLAWVQNPQREQTEDGAKEDVGGLLEEWIEQIRSQQKSKTKRALDLNDILEGMKNDPDFIEKHKEEIVNTFRKQFSTSLANEAERMIRSAAPKEAVRRWIERNIQPHTNPVDDLKLQAVLSKEKENAITAEKGDEEDLRRSSPGTELLEEIKRTVNPRYKRLASVFENPAVRGLPEGDAAVAWFKKLQDRERQPELLGDIDSLRGFLLWGNRLYREDPEHCANSERALEDLLSFLSLSETHFAPAERAAFLEIFARVSGSLAFLREQSALERVRGDRNADEKVKQEYRGKLERIERFFVEHRGSGNRNLRGKNGFMERLENAGRNDGEHSPFLFLLRGLLEHGWIASLRLSDRESVVFSLIALEEVALHYAGVAEGTEKTLTPEELRSRVRNRILQVALSAERRTQRPGTLLGFPQSAVRELQREIERKMEGDDEIVSLDEVRELDLIVRWLAADGIDAGITRETLRRYETVAIAETRDLERDAEIARERLLGSSELPSFQSAIIDAATSGILLNAIGSRGLDERYGTFLAAHAGELHRTVTNGFRRNPWVLKRFADEHLTHEEKQGIVEQLLEENEQKDSATNLLLSALNITEERITLFRKITKRTRGSQEVMTKLTQAKQTEEERIFQRAYAENLIAKEERRKNQFPETFQEEYEERVRQIRKESGAPEEADGRIRALHEENARRTPSLQEVYLLQTTEKEALIRLALQAQVRLRARRLKERYHFFFRQLKPEVIEDLDRYPFFRNYDETVRALERLENLDLESAPEPSIAGKAALGQLNALERNVRNPLAETKERMAKVRLGRKAAKTLLQNAEEADLSDEIRSWLKSCAARDSFFEAPTVNALLFYEKNPEYLKRSKDIVQDEREKATVIDDVSLKRRELGEKTAFLREEIRKVLALHHTKKGGPFKRFDLSRGLGVVIEDEHFARIDGILRYRKQATVPESVEKLRLAQAEAELERIELFAQEAKSAFEAKPESLNGEEFAQCAKEEGFLSEANAAYIPAKPGRPARIVVNEGKMGDQLDREAAVLEEREHILQEQVTSFLNPRFFLDVYKTVDRYDVVRVDGKLVRLRTLFRKRAEFWLGKGRPPLESDEYKQWRHEAARELYAKLKVFHEYGGRGLHKEDIELLQAIMRGGVMILPQKSEDEWIPELSPLMRRSDEEEEDEDGDEDGDDVEAEERAEKRRKRAKMRRFKPYLEGRAPGEDEPARDGFVEGSRVQEDLDGIYTKILTLRSFLKTHPEVASLTGKDGRSNADILQSLNDDYRAVQDDFNQTDDPERNEELTAHISQLHETLKKNERAMQDYDAKKLDLRGEPTVGGMRQLWNSIEWVSLADLSRIFKDAWEDIKRQYNRRQEGVVGRVGGSITGWIPEKIPYAGKLSAEFHRREKQAELDEIDQWRKALKDLDSFELQETLHRPINRDHLRAIIEELVERGRLDWNDQEFWKTLSRFSVFDMPIKECERSESLREEWLRKLIEDIYNDKEFYRSWKQNNDSNIESGKKKYSPEADRLSNLGGLAGELEKQLRIFTEIRERQKRGESVPMDSSVQPHLYEEIIHYSIRNGKMSMEQKFYYLVQGVACGLLSLDRLRTLAGEEGEILQIFPFIDYFYQKNNTFHEIQVLAERLRESADINHPDFLRPGLKTTLWLELEVARQESVQQRLRKGIERRSGEMDHDDMHFFIPRIGYKAIDSMATPQGGGRQKMTTDGWRNGYSGYNSFFKSFGILAKLEEEGVTKFTTADAQQVAMAIAGFVRMDGILTKRSVFGDTEGRRPSIPWGEMKSTRSVVSASSHGETVYKERSNVDAFAKDFLRRYGYGEDALAALLYSTEEQQATEERQQYAKALSDGLETWIMNALRNQGSKEMKQVLKDHIDSFTSHGKNYTLENARRSWEEREAARREIFRAA